MYAQDRAAIAMLVGVGGREWENRAAGVILAATFTVRAQTVTVRTALEQFAAGDMGTIYMARRLAYDAIRDNRHIDILRRARAAHDVGDYAGCILALTDHPGLGIVKAGFVAQMIWGEPYACIDGRNAQEFELREDEYNLKGNKKTAAVKRDMIYRYLAQCALLGGSEYLWDNWCRRRATEYKRYIASTDPAETVSREHVGWVRLANKGLWG